MNKTVIITGASRGIGKATATLFAQKGDHVILNYHTAKQQAMALQQSLVEQGCSVLPFQADVTDRAQVDEMTRFALQQFGHIDVLVNNAGIAQQKLFTDLTEQDWDAMFNTDVKALFYTCQSVLPSMLAQKQGKIINLSSIWGIAGASCEVHYSAAKAAVIGLTKALAKELGPSHIQVNCVAPGVICTDMNQNLDEATLQALKEETPLETLGTPEDIANAIYFLASAQSDFITGQILSPNGGFVI